MVYPIVVYGDPALKKKGKEIEVGSEEVKILAEDMFETMRNANGVGLAAPQIGKSIRMFIVDTSAMEDEEVGDFKQVFINPELIEESGEEWAFEEGCLSIPDIREDIYRQAKVRVRYFDENWIEHEGDFDGIVARIIQHEFDHIAGILFTDHLTPLKRRLLKGKLTNISKGKVDISYRILAPMAKV
jgi:peptide deformylase